MAKAQGLSFNVIIVAALALLVLIVLSVIFIRQTGIFSKNVESCASKGGVCAKDVGGECPVNKTAILLTPDCAVGEEKDGKCCFNPLGK